MYKKFYKLQHNPFRLTPDPQYVYLTEQHREAFSGLIYSVLSKSGLTLLAGEAGTGKTTLLYTLRSLLEKRQACVVLCVNPTLSAEDFYDFLLSKIGATCPSSRKSQQLLALEELLQQNKRENKLSILMVDEAHRIPMELLEEIRLLLNFETSQEKLLEIIMAGQPELSEIFRRPELRQLKQRVSYVCKLEPLKLEDVREFIRHRLNRAGGKNLSLFPDATIRTIYRYTNGIPRLVNTLCDNCLQIGFALQSENITTLIIEEAATDLEMTRSPRLQETAGTYSGRNGDFETSLREASPAAVQMEMPPQNTRKNELFRSAPLESYDARQKSLGLIASLKNWLR